MLFFDSLKFFSYRILKFAMLYKTETKGFRDLKFSADTQNPMTTITHS